MRQMTCESGAFRLLLTAELSAQHSPHSWLAGRLAGWPCFALRQLLAASSLPCLNICPNAHHLSSEAPTALLHPLPPVPAFTPQHTVPSNRTFTLSLNPPTLLPRLPRLQLC